ncbi:hypothetical protein [uncultured Gilvimarinus sp.]|uniref:hypothetical protein n=1 Tax=uncultured Gilvimarinus sp. TaxID=1689143 RepID=UPI0030DDAF70
MTKLQKINTWLALLVGVLTAPPALWGFVEWLNKSLGVELNLWEYIKAYYSFMYGWLFISYSVPAWCFVVAFITAAAVAFRWFRIEYKKRKVSKRWNGINQGLERMLESASNKPRAIDVLNRHRSMIFFGAKWTWEWTYSPPRIMHLKPFCTRCGEQLILRPDANDPDHNSELVCNSEICEGFVVNIFGGWSVERIEKQINKDLVSKAMRMLHDAKVG